MKPIITCLFSVNRKLIFLPLLVLFTFVFSFISYSQTVPEWLYFKYEGSGNTIPNSAQAATALSASATINGTLTQGGTGQFGAGLQGAAASATNIVNTNCLLNTGTSGWTISMWLNGVASSSSIKYLFGTSAAGSSSGFRCFTGGAAGTGGITVRGATNMTNVTVSSGIFDAAGSPVVIHFVYDPVAAAIHVYKNGVFVSSTTQPANMTVTTSTDFLLFPTGTTGLLAGQSTDEFRFYNRALSAAEITATWNTPLNECSTPTGFTHSGLMPTTVTISWNPVSGQLPTDYEWAVIPSSTPPASGLVQSLMFTSANVGGLTPNTMYYSYVRTVCTGATPSESDWAVDSFKTPRPCDTPENITITDVTINSAFVKWDKVEFADAYQYAFSTNPLPPTFGVKIADTFVYGPGFKGGRTYYVHVRSVCTDYPFSVWAKKAFYVLAPVDVENVGGRSDFNVSAYPNPVKDMVTIEVTGASAGGMLTVSDITGKVIKTTGLVDDKANINLQDVATGMYMIRYMDDEHNYTMKITKQ